MNPWTLVAVLAALLLALAAAFAWLLLRREPEFPRMSDRKLSMLLIVGGFVLALGTLAHVPIPAANSEYFGQLMMTLATAVGIIIGAIWKTNQDETPPGGGLGGGAPPSA